MPRVYPSDPGPQVRFRREKPDAERESINRGVRYASTRIAAFKSKSQRKVERSEITLNKQWPLAKVSPVQIIGVQNNLEQLLDSDFRKRSHGRVQLGAHQHPAWITT
jgi:hypothetical protein